MAEKPHKRLVVWQKAIDFVERVYRLTDAFPNEEQFGLITQMRRAAVSIASNIAEGAARQSTKEMLQFLFVARGSISELDTQLIIAHRLRFIDGDQYANTAASLNELGRLLNGLVANKQVRVSHSLLTHSLTH